MIESWSSGAPAIKLFSPMELPNSPLMQGLLDFFKCIQNTSHWTVTPHWTWLFHSYSIRTTIYWLQMLPNQLCNREGIGKLPTTTQARKVVATSSANLDESTQTFLANHICHSTDVQSRYYQTTHSTQQAGRASIIIHNFIKGKNFTYWNLHDFKIHHVVNYL